MGLKQTLVSSLDTLPPVLPLFAVHLKTPTDMEANNYKLHFHPSFGAQIFGETVSSEPAVLNKSPIHQDLRVPLGFSASVPAWFRNSTTIHGLLECLYTRDIPSNDLPNEELLYSKRKKAVSQCT